MLWQLADTRLIFHAISRCTILISNMCKGALIALAMRPDMIASIHIYAVRALSKEDSSLNSTTMQYPPAHAERRVSPVH